MLRRLDRIRFRGHRRDDFLDLAESPNASDTECGDEGPLRTPRTSPRDSEELRDPAGPGTLIMAAGVQDLNRTEFDRLNEIKGHLEIALLEKHFLHVAMHDRTSSKAAQRPAACVDRPGFVRSSCRGRRAAAPFGGGERAAVSTAGHTSPRVPAPSTKTSLNPARLRRVALTLGELLLGERHQQPCVCFTPQGPARRLGGQRRRDPAVCFPFSVAQAGPPREARLCDFKVAEEVQCICRADVAWRTPAPDHDDYIVTCVLSRGRGSLQACRVVGTVTALASISAAAYPVRVQMLKTAAPEDPSLASRGPVPRFPGTRPSLSVAATFRDLRPACVQQQMAEQTEEQTAQQPPKSQAQVANGADRRGQGLCPRVQKWFFEKFGEYVEDFRFQPEESAVETEEPLSARRLTENMRRLKRGARPVTSFVKNLSALSDWYSVYTSAIAFTVYVNAVWHGWAIPMFLFLAILRLSLNYLIARGWRIQWSIVPEVSEVVEPPKEDLTVSEKFQLVLDVAQKAQNLFGKMADILEKIKNLFMWVQPEITQKLYVALWAAFLASCFFPYRLVGLALGLYAGVKFFLIDFIFKRCPRLRAKYDTPYIIWKGLPTDPQLKERSTAATSRRPQTASRSYVSSAPASLSKDEDAGRFHSTKKGNFHEIFNLTENERPLAACENGWRCCLINRDRKMPTDYIRNGLLYVTENYLCFESSKSGSSKRNKVIKLVDITDIQKYKVLSVLPGSGMGIAVSTPSTQKPLVFGAMVHRDEAFETIFSQYVKITAAAASGSDS
ncbi:GRAM domain-containing protein 4 [Pteropus alecto]|uniref:GRAM domain-containing protein 4 n=1 Tax=Pteropus alecto TaxID=9402 RepID=UPI000D5390FB|nr:GRAM domain-containing protein 4 [Pteropus alecto]